MSLQDCIAKAGKALDARDAEAIQSLVAQGVPEQQAVQQHLQSLDAGLREIEQKAVEQGGRVVEPPTRVLNQSAERNSLGLFSPTEQAVIDLKLPGWKDEASAVSGTELWNKISKLPGVKKEELEYIGLEQFLKSGDKFTRNQVLDYIREGGVQVEETVASDEKPETDASFDWAETVDEDSSNWEGRVEDFMYEWDRGQDPYFMDDDAARDQMVQEAGVQRELRRDHSGNDALIAYLEEHEDDATYADLVELIGEDNVRSAMRDSVEETASQEAEREYMDNPYRSWYDSETGITIRGNDDIGYTIEDNRGRTVGGHRNGIYSFNEAEIQARNYAFENGLFEDQQSEDDESVARWGDYTAPGRSSNYREVKITLPQIKPAFHYDTHFPDANIVAFLRVDDRDLHTGIPTTAPIPDSYKIPGEKYSIKELRDNLVEIENETEKGQDILRRNGRSKEDSVALVKKWIGHTEESWRTGGLKQKTYFIEEFQSDWHQQGRKKGYKLGLDVEELQKAEIATRKNFVAVAENIDDTLRADLMDYTGGVALSDLSYSTRMMALYQRSELKDQSKQFFSALKQQQPEIYKAFEQYIAAREAVNAETEGVPNAPFKGEAWLQLGLKRALIQAAEKDYPALAWADTEVLVERWNERYRELYTNQYNGKMVSIIKKLTGVEPVHMTLEGEPYPSRESISAELEAEIKKLSDREQAIEASVALLPGFPMDGTVQEQAAFANDNMTDEQRGTINMIRRERHAMQKKKDAAGMPQGYWVVPLSQELRDKINKQGFTLFQGDKRASINIVNGRRIIRLGQKSDLSSFVHEAAHLFIDVEAQLAREFGVTANQQKLLDHLGIKSFDEFTDDLHEQMAESFEAYLRTGKAPSVGLRQVFAKFAQWLTRIYQTLKGLPNQRLSPEVTAYFDRLLATQEEIDRAAADPMYDQFFRSKEQAGMTDKQWADHLRKFTMVKQTAQTTIQEKVLKQYAAMRTKQWNDERAPMVEEERTRLAETTPYKVLADLEKAPLDLDLVKEALGVTTLPPGLKKYVKKNSLISPESYVEVHNVNGVSELFSLLLNTPPLKQAATDAAQVRMIAKHGDILNDGTLEEEVRMAMHNDEQAELLLSEINALRKTAPAIDRENLKTQARRLLGTMTYKDLRPNLYYQAEIRAAKAAATAKTDAERAEAKLQQLANHYLFKFATEMKRDMDSQRAYVRKVQMRTYDTKEVHPEYVQNLKALANLYQMQKGAAKTQVMSGILGWYTAQVSDPNKYVNLTLLDPTLIEALSTGDINKFEIPHFDTMTADQLQGLYDMLRHLRFVGGQMSDLGAVQLNNIKDELENWIYSHNKKLRVANENDTPETPTSLDRIIQDAKHFGFTSIHLKNLIETIDGFDSDENGPAVRHLWMAINDAENEHLRLQRTVGESLSSLVTGKVPFKKREIVFTKENGGVWRTKSDEERFMVAYHWGTESNREALRQGQKVTDNDVMKIMSTLTPEQLNLVNAMWATNEVLWPRMSEAAVQMLGVAPPKLEALPFTVNGVKMTGGYARLYYNNVMDELNNDRKAGEDLLRATPSRLGSTYARIGSGGKPVLLTFDTILRAYSEATHYIAYGQTGRRMEALLNSNRVRTAIIATKGEGFHRALIESVSGRTSNRNQRDMHPMVSRLMRGLRANATFTNLAYSLRNTVQQLSGFAPAMKEVGPARFVEYASRIALNREDVVGHIQSKSEFMRARGDMVDREAASFLKQLTLSGPSAGLYDSFKRMGFMPQRVMDALFAYPVWMAKYDEEIAKHGDERKAVEKADGAVARTVGTGSDLYLGGLFRSNQSQLINFLTTFGSFGNAILNRLYRESKGFSREGVLTVNFFNEAFTVLMLSAIISAAVTGDVPEDKSPEGWVKWALTRWLAYFSGTMVILRDFGTMVFHGYAPKTVYSGGQESVVRIAKELSAYAEDRQSGVKTTADVLKAAGAISPVPIPGLANVTRFLSYMDSYEQGKEGDTFNPYLAIVEGPNRNE